MWGRSLQAFLCTLPEGLRNTCLMGRRKRLFPPPGWAQGDRTTAVVGREPLLTKCLASNDEIAEPGCKISSVFCV